MEVARAAADDGVQNALVEVDANRGVRRKAYMGCAA
jgi:hypothetical protein